MFAILSDVKAGELLALGRGQDHVHLGQTRRRRGFDAGNLPTQLRFIAKGLLHERIYGGLPRKADGYSRSWLVAGFAVAEV
jgi:hypothetical protein